MTCLIPVEAGAKYLKQLFDKYLGNLGLALVSYNAGPAAADEAKGIPDIPEPRN
jgi:soluble lytic murein transglycosylase-like protein